MQINNGKTVRIVAEQKDNFQSAPRAQYVTIRDPDFEIRIFRLFHLASSNLHGADFFSLFPPPPLPFFSSHGGLRIKRSRHVPVYVLTAAILFGE